MTIAYCVMNNGSGCTTPAEFEGNELEFVRDLTLGGVPMPKDETYPERGETRCRAGRCTVLCHFASHVNPNHVLI